ncbi:MAG: archaemetzincin family Zn-dependent metalloprotease [Promethearchaeota archaeon]
MKKTIGLLKIGEFDESILIKLKKNLEQEFKEFNVSVSIIQEKIPLDEAKYNPIRRQYEASKVLNSIILYNQNKQYFRILGVMDRDIFTNGLNFVFGIAMSPKFKISRVPIMALISITRLRENFYGRPEIMALFELRILKEAIHELGHTFGLGHCNKFCIMRFSNSLADTDEKPPKFCDSCQVKLKNFIKI